MFYNLIINEIRYRNLIPLFSVCLIELFGSTHGIRITCPRATGYTAHHVPKHGRTENFIHPFTSVAHHTETTVDGLADAYTIKQKPETRYEKIRCNNVRP